MITAIKTDADHSAALDRIETLMTAEAGMRDGDELIRLAALVEQYEGKGERWRTALPAPTGRVVGMPMTGWCVRALLNAKADVWPAKAVDPSLPMKRQTRRVVKWKPRRAGLNLCFSGLQLGHYNTVAPESGYVLRTRRAGCWLDRTFPAPPPYRPGDVVYIREGLERGSVGSRFGTWEPRYRADHTLVPGAGDTFLWRWVNDYTPSIFMPKDAARLWCVVAGVRPPERVQSITADDVAAEGLGTFAVSSPDVATEMFAKIWEPLNGKRPGCSWPENPWVWPIVLARVSGP